MKTAIQEGALSLIQFSERNSWLDDPLIIKRKYRKLVLHKRYLLIYQLKGTTVYVDAVQLLRTIEEKLHLNISQLQVRIDQDKIAYLSGKVEKWEDVVNVGFLVAKEKKIRNVVNDIQPRNQEVIKVDRSKGKVEGEQIGIIGEYDVVIIGAGITGCGIARELSKYNLKIAVVEKDSDVSEGATKANDGMVHPGNAVKPRTLKAKLNIEGNRLYSKWAEELNFEFNRIGSLILSYSWKDRKPLFQAYVDGKTNKVPRMKTPGGLQRNVYQCLEDYNIPLHLSTTVTSVKGKHKLEGITVQMVDQERRPIDGTQRYIPCDLLVLSVGLIPENELSNMAGVLLSDVTKGPIVNNQMMTEIDGIFAAGNVSTVFDLVDYVSITGEIAAKGAYNYIINKKGYTEKVEIQQGNNVSLLIPMNYNLHTEECNIFFRATKVIEYGKVSITIGNKVIYEKRRQIVRPQEMIHVNLTEDCLQKIQGEVCSCKSRDTSKDMRIMVSIIENQ